MRGTFLLIKFLIPALIICIVTIIQSCSTTKTAQQNPNWKNCPFYGLEYTYVKESDTLSRSLNFNDSLIVGLESDLKTIKANGKVTNKLSITVDRFTSKSSQRSIDLDDQEYIEFIQSKTKSICGLYETLREGKIYTDPESKKAAVTLLTSLIESLGNYGEKKKEELKANSNTD